ncbi:DUF1697 domain-containing protein [Sphingomonas mucosissima]|uniref:DUF1697 domain-containing protein n=1 Tax=Sphingomonas mucosissima TaxID=370959 RepID=A0A245ZPR9_9SPHN|nr:DUF1697 domain-containing protein [Sphingomonas mucosissima]OWK31731.1 hypothetical protein SPMU_00490 [Sphingomonas mucosissima]
MIRWAALPRAINAGKPLIMAELRALCERSGMGDVSAILSSGNVVFTCDADAQTIEARLKDAAKIDLELDTTWFVRSHAELAQIVAAAPFPDAIAARPNHVQVLFHGQVLDLDRLRELAERHDGPEQMHPVGRELYVDYPAGIGRSKLPQLFNKAKMPLSTARNWNTLLKLVDATR